MLSITMTNTSANTVRITYANEKGQAQDRTLDSGDTADIECLESYRIEVRLLGVGNNDTGIPNDGKGD